MFKFHHDYELVNMYRILLIMMNLILILTENHGTMCVPMHIVAITQGNLKIFFWKSEKIQGIMMRQRALPPSYETQLSSEQQKGGKQ